MNKKVMGTIFAGSLVLAGTLTSVVISNGYAAWTFNSSSNQLKNVNVLVTDADNWSFLPYESGTTIVINDNGTAAIIDSEGNVIEDNIPVTYETDGGQQTVIENGTTQTTINILDDGTVEITSLSATTTRNWAQSLSYILNGQTLYLPEQYTVNGTELEVTKLSTPVKISGSVVLNARIVDEVIVPEGYVSLCDYAFYNSYLQENCVFNLPSTLEYMGALCFNNALNPSITYASTVEDFKTLAANSASNWIGQSSSTRTTITCIDGTLTARYINGRVVLS
jgi:hypothetical protein